MGTFEQSFAAARTDPERRTDFLRTLHEHAAERERLAPYIKGIVYETRIPLECLDRGALPLMRTDTPPLARFHRPGSGSIVRVWPRAFDRLVHGNLDEFLSTLYDHEGWHAMEYCDRPEAIVEYMPAAYVQQSQGLQRLANICLSKQTDECALLKIHSDIRAYGWQLQRIQEGIRRVSDVFAQAIARERELFLGWIRRSAPVA
ncbi:hypothetical protein COU79_04080 [Candidatus Peregrinibacteria bacterium CG10_big_fil_rev_8_21_14_0_10_54_7]|nr:MAG: hypothetical protein COU79_04080 [Candidatus Peregrinibacteria bacterium CG10_big_fil_rev_8_21_14_0_10_54_7]